MSKKEKIIKMTSEFITHKMIKLTQSEILRASKSNNEYVTIAVRPQANKKMKVFLVGVTTGRIYEECEIDGFHFKTIHDGVVHCCRFHEKLGWHSEMTHKSRHRPGRLSIER